MSVGQRASNERLIALALCAMLTLWFLRVLAASSASIPRFDGPETDGIFQLYNAMRRLDAGQRPGRDFLLFHGPGILYLHYPLYRAFGGSFVAAEWARVWPSAILYALSTYLFFRTIASRVLTALALTVGALLVSAYLTDLFVPALSMLGVRSFAPVLAASAMMVSDTSRRGGVVLCGALALALVLGFEQGAAAIAAVSVVMVLFAPAVDRPRTIRRVIAIDVCAIAAAFMVLVLCGGVEGALRMLHYQFVDIPGDQMWYFGAPPLPFLGRWRDFRLLYRDAIPFIVACVLTVNFWRKRRAPTAHASRRQMALSALLLYGILACSAYLGIVDVKYGYPLHRSVILVMFAVGYQAIVERPLRAHQVQSILVPASRRLVAGVSFLVVVVCAVLMVPSVRRIADAQSAPVFSARIMKDRDLVDSVLRASGLRQRTWSTYVGLMDARRGTEQPAPDYQIHALGPEGRQRYIHDFERWNPDVVQTLRASLCENDEGLAAPDWPFLESLLSRYSVAALMSERVLWTRRPVERASSPFVNVPFDPGTSSRVTLPDPADLAIAEAHGVRVLQVVELAYETSNPWHALPVVGATPRYLVDLANTGNHVPVSLPPTAGRMRFPVLRTSK
ncbi:MAG: hypothetical protein JWM95_2369, partial [Gemmatimonadetes bacterium]|nr:hypothetical protein [Gemmatimonadota bacterium]